ncbi:MAG: hypothetical protein A2015_15895 [Spirochaetes bacterium GWF1_31_7]|nr:MAG: hypothetical protein A2Y30_13270 [Spirochaetes bacterium GWE1_32_154]OHD49936.1 MAG: hypothetical protein A2Y29_11315 [Spirochaetes bacterium GWE2_31_10]OHD52254.1 MAG: hypothetical protein A2015_15895 [Spirochaetes bacterium GWF1_31_7]OHD81020.1 MAG: hypothetical protein A2355_12545 [Spirochaetes bacterium RIFOXYB1_FULL_32_8]HBD92607.1 hypothetical protein [Spirochaetia bacterium]
MEMSFEIEKKYCVLNYDLTKQLLDTKYGKHTRSVKAGYWWTEVSESLTPVLEVETHKIQKKNIEHINALAEIKIPEVDYQYARIRVLNNETYVFTVKNKSLVAGIEQNTEYEYELDKETIIEILKFLSKELYIFYYNIKDTLLYTAGDVSIELSTFNDLKNAYLEIEVLGNDQEALTDTLNEVLKEFVHYPIREELLSYNQLSKNENSIALRTKKTRDYSKEALKKLKDSIDF